MATRITTTTESGDGNAAVFKSAPVTNLLYDEEVEHGATLKWLHTVQHVPKGDSHIFLLLSRHLQIQMAHFDGSSVKKWAVLLNGVFYSFMGAVTGPYHGCR